MKSRLIQKAGFKYFWSWLCKKHKTPLQRVELYATLALLVFVPFYYLSKLTPKEKTFFFFQAGYYSDLQEFVIYLTYWLLLAILSTYCFFLCKRRYSPCIGVLSLNYWWMTLCSLGWSTGILQEYQQLYMLPIAALGFYPLWKYRDCWQKQAYKGHLETRPWQWGDYSNVALILLSISFNHIYLLFPQTADFYFIHSGWFGNVQNLVYFFGIFSGAILWIGIWFFNSDNNWLHIFIAWPLTMFSFKLISMVTVNFGITKLEQAYCFIVPMAFLLTHILCRVRGSLYIRTHRQDVRHMIRSKQFSFWRDWILSGIALFMWFVVQPHLPDLIYTTLLQKGWFSYDMQLAHQVSKLLACTTFVIPLLYWLASCVWFWRLYISLFIMTVCFVTMGDFEIHPYEDSGSYMILIGLVAGAQMWRERKYLLLEMMYHDQLKKKDAQRRWYILNAREASYYIKLRKKTQDLRQGWEMTDATLKKEIRERAQHIYKDICQKQWDLRVIGQLEEEKLKIQELQKEIEEEFKKTKKIFEKEKKKIENQWSPSSSV
ncbi:MAG: hypothetical protein ABI045_01685 [Flavobacteriales bacterium]